MPRNERSLERRNDSCGDPPTVSAQKWQHWNSNVIAVAVLTADGSVAVQRYRPLAVLTADSCDDLQSGIDR